MKKKPTTAGLAVFWAAVLIAAALCVSCPPEYAPPTTTVEDPSFSPDPGTYPSDQGIIISTTTAGASIYYTTATGGATPEDPTSSSTLYTAAIPVAGDGTTVTIKAVAQKTGMNSSAIVSATYIIAYGKVATPELDPVAGTYVADQSVTITTTTAGASIYYTTATGGAIPTDPTSSSTLYTAAIPVAGNGTVMTIKAVAIKSGMTDSSIASAAYTITYPKAATPTFNPAAGTYAGAQSVAIGTTTAGASIYYTTDGSTPTTSSTLYTGTISVAASMTLKAIAARSGYVDSAVASAEYVILTRYLHVIGAILPASSTYLTPCYWKDGTLHTLSMGASDTYGQAYQLAYDSSWAAYIVGATGTSSTVQTPCYWKDGTRHTLPMPTADTYGQAFGVAAGSAGHMYIAGATGASSTSGAPCYWYDDSRIALAMGASDTVGTASSILMSSSGDVYATGGTGASSTALAPCYWLNGTRYTLPMGASDTFGIANCVIVDSAGNVYITGATGTSSTATTPCYWKNGTRYALPMGTGESDGAAVYAALDSSDNFSFAGYTGTSSALDRPCYWKNGALHALSMGTGQIYGRTLDVYVDGTGDIYTAGMTATMSAMTPYYWVNDTQTALSIPSNYGNAYGIVMGP